MGANSIRNSIFSPEPKLKEESEHVLSNRMADA